MRIVRTYGSTETSGGCVYDGVPLDGVELAIVDDEVRISGPTLADGYLGDPERTAAIFPADADGTRWYRTGDGGELAGGVLRITGRLDNVIVSGGVNVSLDRVEAAVRGIPGLESAVVIPRTTPGGGRDPPSWWRRPETNGKRSNVCGPPLPQRSAPSPGPRG